MHTRGEFLDLSSLERRIPLIAEALIFVDHGLITAGEPLTAQRHKRQRHKHRRARAGADRQHVTSGQSTRPRSGDGSILGRTSQTPRSVPVASTPSLQIPLRFCSVRQFPERLGDRQACGADRRQLRRRSGP